MNLAVFSPNIKSKNCQSNVITPQCRRDIHNALDSILYWNSHLEDWGVGGGANCHQHLGASANHIHSPWLIPGNCQALASYHMAKNMAAKAYESDSQASEKTYISVELCIWLLP